MDETRYNTPLTDSTDEHVPASEVAGAHESDGTMGRVAGTGSGAISGGIVGAAVAGPVGAVVGAIAGGALGAAAGEAAHHVGDDHDDVNVETGSGGDMGRLAGTGAGGVSGAIVGGAVGGPLGSVVGAAAGGMLGAEAGDAAKDMGGPNDGPTGDAALDSDYDRRTSGYGSTAYAGTTDISGSDAVLPGVIGATPGIAGAGVPVTVPPINDDTNYGSTLGGRDNPDYDPGLPTGEDDNRGIMERLADAADGHRDTDTVSGVLDDSDTRVSDNDTRRTI